MCSTTQVTTYAGQSKREKHLRNNLILYELFALTAASSAPASQPALPCLLPCTSGAGHRLGAEQAGNMWRGSKQRGRGRFDQFSVRDLSKRSHKNLCEQGAKCSAPAAILTGCTGTKLQSRRLPALAHGQHSPTIVTQHPFHTQQLNSREDRSTELPQP